MSKKIMLPLAGIAAFMLISVSLQAQGGPPPPPSSSPDPIDGGVVFMLLGALVHGYRKLRATEV